MEGEEGKKIRGKGMQWKKLAKEASGSKGSSSTNLNKLIHEIF